ncbi:MAG: hypothetical protein LBP64_00355 [Tannerella sp.]|jgi:hypothetical protein|nr:hypothetical protein [Tannerella sp.]
MSNNKDWIPKSREGRYNQAKQSMTYLSVSANLTRMGLTGFLPWITESLRPAYEAFAEAFEDWKNPAERTPIKTAALKTAESAFIPLYRHLYMGMLKENPLVTDADLMAMGMPERNAGKRRQASVPDTSPVASVKLPEPGIVEIHFRDGAVDSSSRAKPAGVHGAEIAWTVSDTPPAGWSQLEHSSFDTASPFRLAFEGDRRGRRLYFALRWENTRGEKGPWSEIRYTVIP